MIFEFKNLGPIKDASIEMGKLTVVCGKNNTGKTYLSYALKHILDIYNEQLSVEISDNEILTSQEDFITIDLSLVQQKINENLSNINEDLNTGLSDVFNANENNFEHTQLKISHLPTIKFDDEAIDDKIIDYISGKDFLTLKKEKESPIIEVYSNNATKKSIIRSLVHNLEYHFTDSLKINFFFIVAERIGLHDFTRDKYRYKDLIYGTRNALSKVSNSKEISKELQRTLKNINENLTDYQNYFSEPVEENIEFIGDLNADTFAGENSFLKEEHQELLQKIEDLLGIRYQIMDGKLMIVDKQNATIIPLNVTSSSVKSLSMLHFWLKHQAEKGDILMIDEPELSLHPENQIKLARLLVKLVNAGIKVWITTHSDYIVKELNNCLMLSNDLENKEKLMTEIGYEKEDILKSEDLRMYIAHTNGTVERIATDEFGMVKSTFDEAMIQQNENTNRIANAVGTLLEAKGV